MNLSLSRPVNGGYVSQWFGSNPAMYAKFNLPGHNGIDYAVSVGTTVYATHDGILTFYPIDATGYGLYCKLDAGDYYTLYGHLSALHDKVKSNTKVSRGTAIAYSGNTGNSTGPHLHFGVRLIRVGAEIQPYKGWVDPWIFRDI